MKLDFEKWMEGQSIHEKAKVLLIESVTCFKAGAYRGAYMLAYLGFQTIIRERLLISDAPNIDLIPDSTSWIRTLEKLRQPTEWDAEVNRLITVDNSQLEKNIFMIHKDVRKEALYLKDKRNACVHGKDHINYPHVECLWIFIQNHSWKFMVNSGIEGLIQQVKLHFNPTENDPNADFTELLNRITSVVHSDQYDELFHKLSYSLPLHFRSKDYEKKFWQAVADNENPTIREKFLEYLKNNLNEFSNFIFVFPSILRHFSGDESTLRKFWNQYLPRLEVYSERADNLYEITRWLFANKKIPTAELNNFWKSWIQNQTLRWLKGHLSVEFVELLDQYGYAKAYKSYLLAERTARSNREFWYTHEQLLPLFLTYFTLDGEFVSHLNEALKNVYAGSFTDAISETMTADDERVHRAYKEICVRECIVSYFG